MWEFFERIRTEYPTMSAAGLLAAGFSAGWAVAWIFFRQQITTYTAKLEHLQEVIADKLPASTYRPLRFRKERPVILGLALLAGGLVLSIVGWSILASNFKSIAPTQTTNDALKDSKDVGASGPLVWFMNLTMEGGPLMGANVFSIQFRGMNQSAESVTLKSAKIVSDIDSTSIDLEVSAGSELLLVGMIDPIPPGSPVTLIAKFGPPNPDAPGKILGLETKVFLEKWRSFSFQVEDSKQHYKIPFNEAVISPFFPNLVGPRVTKKGS